jgi:hypothetical protein
MAKSGMLRWVEDRNAYKILVGKSYGKKLLENT